MKRVLVLGGSGHVGQAVVRGLVLGGDEVAFTWFRGEVVAATLPGTAIRCDLSAPGAIDGLLRSLDALGFLPDALVHCAADPSTGQGDDPLGHAIRVQVGSLLDAAAALAARPTPGTRNIVTFGALAPGQSFPIAPHFAATQGALAGAVMALGHALGPLGFRLNLIALGLLDGGAASAVTAEQVAEYTRFSALRRVGRAEEAASTALWLVRHNTVMNGKVLSANGGL